MNIQLPLPKDFLKEEERTGFVVTHEMKKIWAVQLDLLNELKRVCEKYGLCYYADSGTLLGAVRHKGYIPWDDDIDIVMKRDDYNKLIEVGKTEFSHPYFLQSAHSENFARGYARLRNNDSTALTKADLKQSINHGVFIDIFPLDNVPDDRTVRRIWLIEIIVLSKFISVGSKSSIKCFDDILRKIVFCMTKGIFDAIGYERLIKCYEHLCSRYNCVQTKKISYVAYSHGKKKHMWDSECFASTHSVPYEFTEILIPDGYDSRLKTEYQDYMKPVHASTAHGKVILEPDIPYAEYMRKHSIQELAQAFK